MKTEFYTFTLFINMKKAALQLTSSLFGLQVYRSRLDSDTSQSSLRPKISAGLSPTYTTATLGRNTPARVKYGIDSVSLLPG